MKKISYAIGAYFGNRNVSHSNYKSDYTWYIKKHLEYLDTQTIKVHKIYIICKFDDSVDKIAIKNELNRISENDKRIIIEERENLGATYCSWRDAFHLDNGESDYIILAEDDYTIYDSQAIELMLEYFNNDKDLFYICMKWNPDPYRGLDYIIPAHAALPSGMMDNKMYHKCRTELNVDFRLRYGTGYSIYYANNAEFVENFREIGLKMRDFAETYSCYYAHSDIDLGNPNGKKLMVGLDRDLGYF